MIYGIHGDTWGYTKVRGISGSVPSSTGTERVPIKVPHDEDIFLLGSIRMH
jgi:hypothetical protein